MTELSVQSSTNKKLTHRKFQPSFYGFLFSFAACGVAYQSIAVWDEPLPTACMVIGILSWLLISFMRLDLWGVVLWCLTAMLLCLALRLSSSPASQDGGMTRLLSYFTASCALASLLAFLVAAGMARSHPGRNFLGMALVILTVIVAGGEYVSLRSHFSGYERSQETMQPLLQLQRLGNEVETFRARFGRVPQNEAEFVQFRGKPMPPYYQHYCYEYFSQGQDQYELQCLVGEYIWHYYGPTSAERMHAEFF